MRKLIYTLVLIVTVLSLLALGAIFAIEVDAAQDHPLKIWKQNENGNFMTLNVVDENTGVNYVVVQYDDSRGSGVAMYPRLNADGSLYVIP